MSRSRIRDEYARHLGVLVGDDFEKEIVAAFQEADHGFQRIPRKGGDGGLDGLTNGRTVAFCCYGPEAPKGKMSNAKRSEKYRKKIVQKFKRDLMRLLELKTENRKLAKTTNKILPKVLGDNPNPKISYIKLVASWFEDKAVYGELQKVFAELCAKSDCRFVDSSCELVVWGPADVAAHAAVTQRSLARIENPGLLYAIEEAASAARDHEPSDRTDFDEKFDELEGRGRQSATSLRESFRKGWSTSILLEEKLATDHPQLHAEFEAARQAAATDAQLSSMAADADPVDVIVENKDRLKERMAGLVGGGLPQQTCEDLANAETGRLIGECPLDWRQGG